MYLRRKTNYPVDKGNKQIVYTGSGSSALRFILRNLGLHKGDKIAIPLLTCERAIYSITSEGFIPVFVDISDNELYSAPQDYFSATRDYHVKAIVAISMWGYPINISEITKKP